jgi:phosphoserine phosphatase
VRPDETIAVGDSEGDIPLALNTGYSIAFNCTSPALARIVDYNCRTRDFREVYRKIIEVSSG